MMKKICLLLLNNNKKNDYFVIIKYLPLFVFSTTILPSFPLSSFSIVLKIKTIILFLFQRKQTNKNEKNFLPSFSHHLTKKCLNKFKTQLSLSLSLFLSLQQPPNQSDSEIDEHDVFSFNRITIPL